jgi:hypothetical protein
MRELLKKALESLDFGRYCSAPMLQAYKELYPDNKKEYEDAALNLACISTTIAAIEAELAKPCEPVGWFFIDQMLGKSIVFDKPEGKSGDKYNPLYASPPLSQYEPLTDEEINKYIFPPLSHSGFGTCKGFARAIEAAVLKKIKGE